MDYFTVKTIHLISATVLFGTGIGTAFFMFFTYRAGNWDAVRVVTRLVVAADWLFTTPAVMVQLGSGIYLALILDLDWGTSWLIMALALYIFVGVCWIPVVFIQIYLRNRAAALLAPDAAYRRWMRIWVGLGIPAFVSVLAIFYLMVFKPTVDIWWWA